MMSEGNHRDEAPKNEHEGGYQDPAWEGFKDYVRRIAAVPKEELNEKLAEERREKKEKRAG